MSNREKGHTTIVLTDGLLNFARSRMRDGECCAVFGSVVGGSGDGSHVLATKICLPAAKELTDEALAALCKRFNGPHRRVIGILSFEPLRFQATECSTVRLLRDGRLEVFDEDSERRRVRERTSVFSHHEFGKQ